ncbi:MAG TPA: SRPBCC family protein [Acidimicrobiales bacterium]|nr:SRPBCC family protein [Acidimicrobiales bacterium]
MDGDTLSVERVIPAPAEQIFGLLADAAKHPLIDGSGMVIEPKPDAPQRLSMGSKFGMSMKLGVKYSMVNEVIEFEDDRRIAWQARPKGAMGRISGGRIWRYELEPVDGGTRVRETWDVSKDHQRALLRLGPTPKTTQRNMEKTLERIEEVVHSQ